MAVQTKECPGCSRQVATLRKVGNDRPDINVCHNCWFCLHYSRCYSAGMQHSPMQTLVGQVVKKAGFIGAAHALVKQRSVSAHLLDESDREDEISQAAQEVVRKRNRLTQLMVNRAVKDYNMLLSSALTARSRKSPRSASEPPHS